MSASSADALGDTSRRLVERFYHELWNRADEAVAREILHPDFAFRGSLGVTRKGVDEFVDYVHVIHAALGDYRCTIEDMIVSGHRVAARMTFSGVHRGAFYGLAGTGRRITWAGSAFFTVDCDRLAELWVLGDVDAVKRQLGEGAADSFSK